MTMSKKRPAPLAKVAGPIVWESSAALDPNNSKPLPEFQGAFIAARYGLTPAVAATVASLAWGR